MNTSLPASERKTKLLQRALSILENNSITSPQGHVFTRPAEGLYPHQWNWDSGFITYGYAHTNPERGVQELESFFLGQWSNGLCPHTIFHIPTDEYFPGAHFWESRISSAAPSTVETSGITQPPTHALALWHLYQNLPPDRGQDVLATFYPKLKRSHRYLLTERDPEKSGLVTIVHPWESGLDNSPRWDEIIERTALNTGLKLDRTDLKHIPARNRPRSKDYAFYTDMALRLKEYAYDIRAAYKTHPFLVKDTVSSSLLYLGNLRLMKMAEILNEDTGEIREWISRFEHGAYGNFWNGSDGLFYDLDLVTGKPIKIRTIGSLVPFVTGILSDEQAEQIKRHLDDEDFCGKEACYKNLTPSVSLSEVSFRPEGYWRGPVWLNMNWLMWRGCLSQGWKYRADSLRESMLELIESRGFHEFYDPFSGEGLGARNFSWTAALVLDLLNHDLDE